MRGWVKEPDHIFIGHTEGNEFFEGTGARLTKLAAEMGYRRELMQKIPDSFGRDIFEVYRFRASTDGVGPAVNTDGRR